MRKIMFLLAFVYLLVLAAGAGAEDATPARKDKCPVCGMYVSMFADWNSRIEFKDATVAIFDGAKDMFKYYLDIKKYNPSKNKNDIAAITVMDYYSKTAIDARPAFYVIWSDIYGPMGHEPMPFQQESEARKFLKEHKAKKILRFKDITSHLLVSLDNP